MEISKATSDSLDNTLTIEGSPEKYSVYMVHSIEGNLLFRDKRG